MSASLNGHVEVVNTLLQHGASVDLKKEVHLFAVMYNYSATDYKIPKLTFVFIEFLRQYDACY